MRLPGLDVIFGLAAPAVDILIEHARIAGVEIGDDEACVGPVRAGFDAGDDALDAAPARGPVEELLEAARLAVVRRVLEARLRAGLEIPDMPAQCRGRRDAQDVIEIVGPTPVENLGTAIVTVGAQQDLSVRPVGANCAPQTAQKGANLLAAGSFGGTKNGSDEAALAIEYDDRLKAVFVIMRIEQPQLLAAMNRVKRVVDVQRDPFGNPLEGLAIKIDHGAPHAQQAASVGQIFKTGDGRLRTQFAIRGR